LRYIFAVAGEKSSWKKEGQRQTQDAHLGAVSQFENRFTRPAIFEILVPQ
jgi:hypothetical protein